MTKEEQLRKMQMIAEEYINTPDEDKDITMLAKKYRTKHETITKYFKQNNIEVIRRSTKNAQKTKIINIAVQEYINTPESERSAAAIARKYGLNRKTIIAYAKEAGFTPTQHHNKPDFNNTAFDEIDTEEKAYWLGFLYADGFICAKSNHVGLTLALADIEHLKKYNKFLNYPKGLVVKQNGVDKQGQPLWACSTEFRDSHMWEALNSKGCVPNKSLIIKFPDIKMFKDPSLVRHFVRGYWDGDGSLGIYNNINYVSVIGTQSLLNGIQEYCGIPGYMRHKSGENEAVHCLKYTNLKAFKVATWLYEGATIYLDRKYEIYLKMSRKEAK